MKKTYISPAVDVMTIRLAHIVAESLKENDGEVTEAWVREQYTNNNPTAFDGEEW